MKEFSHLPFSIKNWVRMAEGPEKDRVIKDVQRLYNCRLYEADKKQIFDFSEYEMLKCTVFNICDATETDYSRPKRGLNDWLLIFALENALKAELSKEGKKDQKGKSKLPLPYFV